MKLLFVHDHVFFKTKDEMIYSGAAYPVYAWDRYLNFFDSVNVIGRYGGLYNSNKNSLVLSSRESVSFLFVESLASPLKLVKNYNKVYGEIYALLEKSQALVVRLPSENGLLAIQCAKKLNKPYAIEIVGCSFASLWNYGSVLAKFYAPISFLRMKKAVSQSMQSIYVTKYFLQERYPSKQKALIANASNVEIEVSNKLASRVYKSNKKIIFGIIGNYKTKYKGIHLAIEAFGRIKSEIKDFELRILGRGNKREYDQLIQKYNLQDNVIFCGSLPNGSKVADWLDNLDIYLQPSLTEGLPRATIEAMSRGCVCIGSNAGGIPELLDDEFIHKKGDISSLASLLLSTIGKTPEELKIISKKNHSNSKEYDMNSLHSVRDGFYNALYKRGLK
jgi:glycosyltransferase involved in cell wall biosynthesis